MRQIHVVDEHASLVELRHVAAVQFSGETRAKIAVEFRLDAPAQHMAIDRKAAAAERAQNRVAPLQLAVDLGHIGGFETKTFKLDETEQISVFCSQRRVVDMTRIGNMRRHRALPAPDRAIAHLVANRGGDQGRSPAA